MSRRKLFCALLILVGCGVNVAPPSDPIPVPDRPPFNSAGRPLFRNGEVVVGERETAPLSGGTLAVSGHFAYAANPDAGVVDMVDIDSLAQIWTANVGGEPGRIVVDETGLVHVALRAAGSIATLDPIARTVTKRAVCPSPRGLTVAWNRLFVACAGGELVSMPLVGDGKSVFSVGRDIRDVVVDKNNRVYVSTFKSAELIALGSPMGSVDQATWTIGAARQPVIHPAPFNGDVDYYRAHVAWRTVASPDGSIFELHQYASSRALSVMLPSTTSQPAPYGGQPSPTQPLLIPQVVVGGGLSQYWTGNNVPLSRPMPQAVDLAVSPKGDLVALAVIPMPKQGGRAAVIDPVYGQERMSVPIVGMPVAVAFAPDGRLVMQSRDPAMLEVTDVVTRGNRITTLTPSTVDTGFLVFHTPTRSGLACFSCHPEGGDDGHTWRFTGARPDQPYARRTQSLRGGILGTAPFHWNGEMKEVAQLAHEVFTGRMGGDALNDEQTKVVTAWLERIPALAPPSTIDAASVARGKTLFAEAACNSCHAGPRLTDNVSHVIGRGEALQTPSLTGVWARAPFMHDGCALTLADRFKPECGGTAHGSMPSLSAGQIADLVSYLESL